MTESRLDRRSLLARMALAGGALVLPSSAWLACRPSESPVSTSTKRRSEHYFVFYYMMGGWDLTLLSDPLVAKGRISTQYEPHEIFEAGAHRFGPAMRPLYDTRAFGDARLVLTLTLGRLRARQSGSP